jgi:hypothetical protein
MTANSIRCFAIRLIIKENLIVNQKNDNNKLHLYLKIENIDILII